MADTNQAVLADGAAGRVPVHALVEQLGPIGSAEDQSLDVANLEVIVEAANVRIKEFVGEELGGGGGEDVADALP